MNIEIIKGDDNPVAEFFSSPAQPTPETNAETMRDEYDHVDSDIGPFAPSNTVPADFARKLERERDEAREALSDWENAALHVEADHPNEKHCGCVPVLRKLLNEARESLKHIEEYGTEEINAAIDLRQKLASALVERDEAREKYTTLLTDNMLDVHKLYKAIELIKSLINQIERPAYGVDEAVAKMFLMEEAKKFANEMQQM